VADPSPWRIPSTMPRLPSNGGLRPRNPAYRRALTGLGCARSDWRGLSTGWGLSTLEDIVSLECRCSLPGWTSGAGGQRRHGFGFVVQAGAGWPTKPRPDLVGSRRRDIEPGTLAPARGERRRRCGKCNKTVYLGHSVDDCRIDSIRGRKARYSLKQRAMCGLLLTVARFAAGT
jgi:hypothetical protein